MFCISDIELSGGAYTAAVLLVMNVTLLRPACVLNRLLSSCRFPQIGTQHAPPADIGANFYPSLGPYSSGNVTVTP